MCVAGGFKSMIMERPSNYNGGNYRGTNGTWGAGGKWGGVCLRLSSRRTKISHAGKETGSRKEWFLFLSHLMVSQIIVSKESTTSWSSYRDSSPTWLMGAVYIGCIAQTRIVWRAGGKCYLWHDALIWMVIIKTWSFHLWKGVHTTVFVILTMTGM